MSYKAIFKSAHIFNTHGAEPAFRVSFEFDVPGIGVIKVDQSLSRESCLRIVGEAEAVLRERLCQPEQG